VVEHARQTVRPRHLDTVFDVPHDDQQTPGWAEPIVPIQPCFLILHEVLGLVHLPDVVVQRAHVRQQRVGLDRVRRGLGDARHVERVVVRARGTLLELAEQGLLGIAELDERQAGRDVEGPLDVGEKRERENADAHAAGPGQRRIHKRP